MFANCGAVGFVPDPSANERKANCRLLSTSTRLFKLKSEAFEYNPTQFWLVKELEQLGVFRVASVERARTHSSGVEITLAFDNKQRIFTRLVPYDVELPSWRCMTSNFALFLRL